MQHGDVFIIMGGSGCGKSTVMRALIGMQPPAKGRVWFEGQNLWEIDETARQLLLRRSGVVFQSGGMWSSMKRGLPFSNLNTTSKSNTLLIP